MYATPHIVSPVRAPQLGREEAANVVVDTLVDLVAMAVRSVGSSGIELTVAQLRVLVLLEQHGALSVNAVAHHLGVDQSNASRHCSRLVRLGLAGRNRVRDDGRAVEIRLTARGSAYIENVQEARRGEIAQILDRLPASSVGALASAFAMFHEAAQDVHPE